MATIYDVRRTNLRRLMQQWGGPTALAAHLGHSNGSYLAQLAGPNPKREVGERTARQIEIKLGLPHGFMDEAQAEPQPLDEAALANCLRAVSTAVEDAGLKVSPEKFADVVGLAYDSAKTVGAVDERFIQRLVRLLK